MEEDEAGSWVPDVAKFYTEKEVAAEKLKVAGITRDLCVKVIRGYITKRMSSLADEGLTADSWEAKAVILGKIVELKTLKELLDRV